MGNWISVKGKVQRGYGVASGKSGDPRFPKGTLELQKPFFYNWCIFTPVVFAT